ncbi:MAG: hypothetical protein [Bacteriophage sp.]|nr:MAG: hypothetical protein [Bacteriophage sp.]
MYLARMCNKLSNMFRYECTYLDLKSKLKQAMRYDGDSYKMFIYPIENSCRGIGETRALAKLSRKYKLPLLVPTGFQKYVYEHVKFKPYEVFCIDDRMNMRGKQFDIVLIDDCFTIDEINDYVKPCCRVSVGVSSVDYSNTTFEYTIKG